MREGTSRLAETFNRGTGRRKNAIARVRIQPGEGRVTVNDKDPLAYLGRRVLEMAALAPLRVTSTQRKFDISRARTHQVRPRLPSCAQEGGPSDA